ncbi:hypothetical protein MUK42_35853 [Musa troglodytarum]|uniref:Uncharacterized protein n=1 Tax=Musa troglodytarum TaxID=320322 RepID=A0A9E7KBB8_9LILI|nr:hypothetical protein MUK42_35853 [Musa troglodytarum]
MLVFLCFDTVSRDSTFFLWCSSGFPVPITRQTSILLLVQEKLLRQFTSPTPSESILDEIMVRRFEIGYTQ